MSKTKQTIGVLFTLAFFLCSLPCNFHPGFARSQNSLQDLVKRIEKLKEKSAKGSQSARVKLAESLYQLGEALYTKGDLVKAANFIKEALVIEDEVYNSAESVKNSKHFIPRVHTRVALASIYIKEGKLEKAVALYKEAIKVSETMTLAGEAAKLSCHLGSIEVKRGNIDQADKWFENALLNAKKQKSVDVQVTALVGQATIARVKKDFELALQKLLRAKEIGDVELDGLAYARLLNELGRTYSDMELYEQALAQFNEAEKEFESAAELVLQARTLTSIGQVYLVERESDKAVQVLSKAFAIIRAEKSKQDFARVLLPYGSALADTGNSVKALKYHKKAIELSESVGDSNTRLLATLEVGYDYFLAGDMEKALKSYLEAEQYLNNFKGNVNPELRAATLRDCGMGYRALGQLKAAIQYYRNAAKYFGLAGKTTDQAIMLDSIAVAHLDEGDTLQFKQFHDKAMAVFEHINSKSDTKKTKQLSRKLARARASLQYNYGQYCIYKGKFADAIVEFESSLKDYREAGDQLGHCHALRGLGLTYLMLGQVGKSKDSYEEASVIASRIGNIESQWDCATGLGKAYIKLNQLDKAETALKEAVKLADLERRQFSRDSFKTAQLSLREDCFLELVDLLVRDGRSEEALAIAESGRARAFLDMLEGRKQKGLKLEKAALVSSSLIDDRKDESEPVLVAMAGSNSGAVAGLRAVSVVPKSSQLVSPSAISPVNAKAPDGAELKSLVKGSGSYFIEYIVTPDSLIVWLLNSSGEIVSTKRVECSLTDLKRLIRTTYRAIVTSPKGIDDLHKFNQLRSNSLKELYKVLIGPVEDKLPKDPSQVITVVPYGPLYLVPFAALINSQNKYFVEGHTLSYLPSIAVLRATNKLKAEVNQVPDSLLAFGNPITERNKFLGKLPYAEKEVAKVASLFKGKETKIEVGEAATKAVFKSNAPKYSYLHLATHGLINPESPMDSSVVLAPRNRDDGLLSVKDILQLPALKAKLIVLSACQTGKGKVTGDGVIGLSRAFIIAGTPSVMVSQWNVDDVMTEYQMSLFYKELLSGKEKAAALRTAQLKTITFMEKGLSSSFDDEDDEDEAGEEKDRANPRYWAAFQLIGEHH